MLAWEPSDASHFLTLIDHQFGRFLDHVWLFTSSFPLYFLLICDKQQKWILYEVEI